MDILKRFFGSTSETDASDGGGDLHHDIRVATCALFLEMAHVDGEFSDEERMHIMQTLTNNYALTEEDAAELTKRADGERKGSIDLWQFTNRINQNYSQEEKIEVATMLWKIVYADGHLSEHENYLVHKLGKMLRLTHRELIEAKLTALHDSKDTEAE